MNKFLYLMVVCFLSLGMVNTSFAAFDHSVWQQDLVKYVDAQGGVNYKAWKGSQADLKKYIVQLQGPTRKQVESWSLDEQMAFYINAYNAFTILVMLEHYPIKSIRKITKWKGLKKIEVWDHWKFALLKEEHNLTWVEHTMLRPMSQKNKDFHKRGRIHAAINCASKSCPKLQRFAFTGEDLQNQLDLSMREFINDATRIKFHVVEDDAHVDVSKIFKWFKDDFGTSNAMILKYLSFWANEKNKKVLSQSTISLNYEDYDWDLNEQ